MTSDTPPPLFFLEYSAKNQIIFPAWVFDACCHMWESPSGITCFYSDEDKCFYYIWEHYICLGFEVKELKISCRTKERHFYCHSWGCSVSATCFGRKLWTFLHFMNYKTDCSRFDWVNSISSPTLSDLMSDYYCYYITTITFPTRLNIWLLFWRIYAILWIAAGMFFLWTFSGSLWMEHLFKHRSE